MSVDTSVTERVCTVAVDFNTYSIAFNPFSVTSPDNSRKMSVSSRPHPFRLLRDKHNCSFTVDNIDISVSYHE